MEATQARSVQNGRTHSRQGSTRPTSTHGDAARVVVSFGINSTTSAPQFSCSNASAHCSHAYNVSNAVDHKIFVTFFSSSDPHSCRGSWCSCRSDEYTTRFSVQWKETLGRHEQRQGRMCVCGLSVRRSTQGAAPVWRPNSDRETTLSAVAAMLTQHS